MSTLSLIQGQFQVFARLLPLALMRGQLALTGGYSPRRLKAHLANLFSDDRLCPTTQGNTPWRAVAAISLAFLCALFAVEGRAPSQQRHEMILAALRSVDLNHAALQRDILRAHDGLLRHYDPLVTSMENLQRAARTLESVLERKFPTNKSLIRALDALSRSIDQDGAEAEEFKTRNALLQNSLNTFTLVLSRLHSSISQETQGEINASNQLGNMMMRFIVDPQPQLAQQIRIELEAIDRSATLTDPDLTTLITHGQMILVSMPKVTQSLTEIQNSETVSRAQKLEGEYLREYAVVTTRASHSRLLLAAISFGLCGYVLFLVYCLREQTNRLRRRFDFESAMSLVKSGFINSPAPDPTAATIEALRIVQRFFDADFCGWATINFETGDIFETLADQAATGPLATEELREFAKSACRNGPSGPCHTMPRRGSLQSAREIVLELPGAAQWVYAAAIDTESSVVAVLMLGCAEDRARYSNDERSQIRAATETLLGSIDFHRNREDKRILEGRLAHSQRLEAVGTLAGGIAHEFNNILGAMLGYGEMALQILRPSEPRRLVHEILLSGARAKHIIEQVLTFSRKHVENSMPFDVCEAVADILPLLQMSVGDTLNLDAKIAQSPAVIEGNPIAIQQIVMNLCKNASEASDRHSTVELRVSRAIISHPRQLSHGQLSVGAYVLLSVVDHGAGIADGTLPHLFEPFYTTKANAGGTGLGLAAVHGNVTSLGGQIHVESRLTQGSRFDLYFPSSPLPPVPVKNFFRDRSVPIGSGETVAIVQNDRNALILTEEKLAALGYEPVGFPQFDAIQAWIEENGRNPDLLILDVASLEQAITPALLSESLGSMPYLLISDRRRQGAMSEHALLPLGALLKPVSSKALAVAVYSKIHPK